MQIGCVSDPNRPSWVGVGDPNVWYDDICISGSYAYAGFMLSGYGGAMRIFDVTNPANPKRIIDVGQCPGSVENTGVDVNGSYAYVTGKYCGLTCFDVRDANSPVKLWNVTGYALDRVKVSGSYAYVGALYKWQGLQTVYIDDPNGPGFLSKYETREAAKGLTLGATQSDEKVLYVAELLGGIEMVDVADANRPARLGLFDTSGSAQDVAVNLPFLYVADDNGGLAILRADLVGDTNCDWAINFADINPFVLALYGPEEYYRKYPDCNWLNADCNDDGRVTFGDINFFVERLPKLE